MMTEIPVTRVDGNAAGGVLFEAFGRDMTAAEGTCRHCARTGLLAEAIAELDDAGVILLCRGCRHTLLTYVHAASAHTLALPGLAQLRWSDA
jgi:hypothetical protein